MLQDLSLPKQRGGPASFNEVDRVGALRFHLIEFLRMNQNEFKAAEETDQRHRLDDQPETKSLEKVIEERDRNIAELEAEKSALIAEWSKNFQELNDEKKKAVKALWDARDSLAMHKSAFSIQIEASKTLK